MALHVLRHIAAFIQNAKFFSLMADEVTDASNKEQVVVCFRSVDENLEAHENFVGIHNVQSITADVLVATLKDTMLRMNLPISNCRLHMPWLSIPVCSSLCNGCSVAVNTI